MISLESIDKTKLDEYPNVIGCMNKPVDLDKFKGMLTGYGLM